jgi:HK97 family phage prohead protease
VTVVTEAALHELESQALDAYRRGVDAPPLLYRDGGKALNMLADKPLVFIANEESPDRMGDVIEAAGWELEGFRKNPVMMLAHDHRGIPIGTWLDVRVEGKQLLSTAHFDAADPVAVAIEGKYRRGIMKGVSVGFRPLEFDIEKTNGRESFRFKKTELLEISAVAVPAHPAALLQRALMYQPRHYSFPETKPRTDGVKELSAVDVERIRDSIRRLKE